MATYIIKDKDQTVLGQIEADTDEEAQAKGEMLRSMRRQSQAAQPPAINAAARTSKADDEAERMRILAENTGWGTDDPKALKKQLYSEEMQPAHQMVAAGMAAVPMGRMASALRGATAKEAIMPLLGLGAGTAGVMATKTPGDLAAQAIVGSLPISQVLPDKMTVKPIAKTLDWANKNVLQKLKERGLNAMKEGSTAALSGVVGDTARQEIDNPGVPNPKETLAAMLYSGAIGGVAGGSKTLRTVDESGNPLPPHKFKTLNELFGEKVDQESKRFMDYLAKKRVAVLPFLQSKQSGIKTQQAMEASARTQAQDKLQEIGEGVKAIQYENELPIRGVDRQLPIKAADDTATALAKKREGILNPKVSEFDEWLREPAERPQPSPKAAPPDIRAQAVEEAANELGTAVKSWTPPTNAPKGVIDSHKNFLLASQDPNVDLKTLRMKAGQIKTQLTKAGISDQGNAVDDLLQQVTQAKSGQQFVASAQASLQTLPPPQQQRVAQIVQPKVQEAIQSTTPREERVILDRIAKGEADLTEVYANIEARSKLLTMARQLEASGLKKDAARIESQIGRVQNRIDQAQYFMKRTIDDLQTQYAGKVPGVMKPGERDTSGLWEQAMRGAISQLATGSTGHMPLAMMFRGISYASSPSAWGSGGFPKFAKEVTREKLPHAIGRFAQGVQAAGMAPVTGLMRATGDIDPQDWNQSLKKWREGKDRDELTQEDLENISNFR